jgi:plasmid stability protein
MKTTLDLPDELIREVKLRAVMQKRTVKDLVAEFLRQGLGMLPSAIPASPPADSLVEVGPQGLPIIRCKANAPARRMSARTLLRLEESAQTVEDLQRAGIPV